MVCHSDPDFIFVIKRILDKWFFRLLDFKLDVKDNWTSKNCWFFNRLVSLIIYTHACMAALEKGKIFLRD